MTLAVAALSAFALAPLGAATAHAGEVPGSVQRAEAEWQSQGIHTEEWCHRIGQDAQREFGWPYKCEWRAPINVGYTELWLWR
jgi:hypothetical protein